MNAAIPGLRTATLLVACWLSLSVVDLRAQPRDEFYWLGEINRASAVMLREQGIVPHQLSADIANALATILANGDKPGAARPADYLEFEQLLIAAGGPDVTRVHSGRSRQDIKGSIRRFFMRDALLRAFETLTDARESLLRLADTHRDAILPAYTYGVQAQPTTMGHYLGGYAEALRRSAERHREAWARVNQAALGSAALGTSSFPVDRQRLADLLGFDGSVVNSFDANQIAPLDTGVEAATLASTTALTIGMFAEDIAAQYTHAKPWLTLSGGNVTGISSIMPQKRNPTALVELRQQASSIVGQAMTFVLQSHNVASGMEDYKMDTPTQALNAAAQLYRSLTTMIEALVFDAGRALAEVNDEYSTTTELADTLQRVSDVPFRVGHHFASELVNFGRAGGLRPSEIPFADARRIYEASARRFQQPQTQLPLGEAEFRRALTAEHMVQSARGLGGPQPAEVARMLADERARLASDKSWLTDRRRRLREAEERLRSAFDGLRTRR